MKNIPVDEFVVRRQKVLDKMGDNAVAILTSAPAVPRNGDAEYPYRQDSNFLYLTGFNEPESILVLVRDNGKMESILFCREKDRNAEVWTGKRLGPGQAKNRLGMSRTFSIDCFDDELVNILDGKEKFFYIFGHDNKLKEKLRQSLVSLKRNERRGAKAPSLFANLETLLENMRVIKSDAEIAVMEQACDITVNAHKRAMRACKPGVFEYELEAEIQHEFLRNGSRSPAYTSIVASGENACILHYCENNKKINDGDLVLIDAGCELSGYAADITRTFPANGRFSSEQKQIYELVLKAQKAAIEVIKPEASWVDPQNIVIEILTKGLVELGILEGNLKTLVEEKAVLPFYMHGHGHFLGLDVHDVGVVRKGETWETLKAGMVLTVEPGIYIDHFHAGVDVKWKGIGVRIEDNVLVTENGCRVLSEGLPKSVSGIEQLMSKS